MLIWMHFQQILETVSSDSKVCCGKSMPICQSYFVAASKRVANTKCSVLNLAKRFGQEYNNQLWSRFVDKLAGLRMFLWTQSYNGQQLLWRLVKLICWQKSFFRMEGFNNFIASNAKLNVSGSVHQVDHSFNDVSRGRRCAFISL